MGLGPALDAVSVRSGRRGIRAGAFGPEAARDWPDLPQFLLRPQAEGMVRRSCLGTDLPPLHVRSRPTTPPPSGYHRRGPARAPPPPALSVRPEQGAPSPRRSGSAAPASAALRWRRSCHGAAGVSNVPARAVEPAKNLQHLELVHAVECERSRLEYLDPAFCPVLPALPRMVFAVGARRSDATDEAQARVVRRRGVCGSFACADVAGVFRS